MVGGMVGYGEAAAGRERSFNRDDSTAEVTSTFLHLGYFLCFLHKYRASFRLWHLCFFKAGDCSREGSLEGVIGKTKEFLNVSDVVMVTVLKLPFEDVIRFCQATQPSVPQFLRMHG